MVARDYIKWFLKDVKRWSPEGIDYMRHKECMAMFNKKFIKNIDSEMPKKIQGENEIDLAVRIYNILNSEYGKN